VKKKCPRDFLKRKITRKKWRGIFLCRVMRQNESGRCCACFVKKTLGPSQQGLQIGAKAACQAPNPATITEQKSKKMPVRILISLYLYLYKGIHSFRLGFSDSSGQAISGTENDGAISTGSNFFASRLDVPDAGSGFVRHAGGLMSMTQLTNQRMAFD
jgi:hypothetical protein